MEHSKALKGDINEERIWDLTAQLEQEKGKRTREVEADDMWREYEG